MRILGGVLFAVVIAAAMTQPALDAATACDKLTSLTLPNVTITEATDVADGAPKPRAGASPEPSQNMPNRRAAATLSSHCRVAATLKPSADSDIKMEVWMPANWNGKFVAVGNGAFNGSIASSNMSAPLSHGYATASTDTGHVGNTGSFALGHPEKAIDFGWRGVHEMTQTSKKIIAAYYGNGPRFSYWNGCSAAGRQGMVEAQRFPEDYDGIIAGNPGLDWTGRASQAVRQEHLLQNQTARIPPAKLQVLHNAVVDACDGLDGLKDGLLADPRKCTFDPGTVQCKAGDEATCLTAAQVATARSMYSPLVNATTKRESAGVSPGSELGWTDLGWTVSARATGLDQYRYFVFKDPTWEVGRFDAQTALARADEADGGLLNALNPNLKPFFDRGGKLIGYHGWSDPQISPGNSVQYYESVEKLIGPKTRDSYRLFMAPGMGHCTGGEGPDTFDPIAALEQWVEQKKAPDQITATKSTNGTVVRTRPLCPFPQIASYKGSGDINAAESFACR